MEWEILMTTQVEGVLERNGRGEGRPLVDTVTASRIANMKGTAAAVIRAQRDPDPAGLRPVAERKKEKD